MTASTAGAYEELFEKIRMRDDYLKDMFVNPNEDNLNADSPYPKINPNVEDGFAGSYHNRKPYSKIQDEHEFVQKFGMALDHRKHVGKDAKYKELVAECSTYFFQQIPLNQVKLKALATRIWRS